MNFFRSLTDKVIFKAFLVFLVGTFIFFGIGDFFYNAGKRNVATVNGHDISIMDFYH